MTNTIFQAENINKKYPKSKGSFMLQDIDLHLSSGEITGVVGENGNGKTTLLRIIAGDLCHTEGDISFPTISLDSVDFQLLKRKIAYIPQQIPRWFGVLKDNLHFTASALGIYGEENEKKVNELLIKLGLEEYAHHKWTEISTGYKLRFQLAKMLIGDPQLLVLDEPIANLDINAQQKFLTDLKQLISESEKGVSVILSSQQLHEIETVSDNIIFLEKGKSLYSGPVKNFGTERTENTFELESTISLEELSQVFSTDEIFKISHHANMLVIETKLDLDAEEFLERIIQTGSRINYFRNISQSTRKLFN